jgi:hypothetical protein
MRRWWVVEVALSLLFPGLLLAQHGGLGGPISSAHFGGAAHAGVSPSFSAPPRSFAPPSGSVFANPAVQRPTFQPRHWGAGNPSHYPNNGRGGVGYRARYPYVYAGYPWLNGFGYGLPLAYGVPYGDDQDDASPAPQQADQPPLDYGPDYGPEPPGPQVAASAPSPFRPAYQGQVDGPPVHPQPATTLIFKDGRPPAQVHNYALTASTLYALDGEARQEIPLSLLNVPATVEVNRTAGVDFALPVSR